jgi:ribosomal protein L11 methyltransferase
MQWLQVHLLATAADADSAAEALSVSGAVSVTYADAADTPIFEPGIDETPLWDATRVTGLFAAGADSEQIRQQLSEKLAPAIMSSWDLEQLPEQDWVRAWMADFKPLCFGDRLWICPSNHQPPAPEQVNVLLDPGLAFGTGTHPTTALCLRWLDQADLRNATVIDYGCGSGVLAIAAALLGAAKVIATDIDPQAIEATMDNANRNGVADRITALLPDAIPAIQADIVLANILSRTLVDLHRPIIALTKPAGHLVLSGILEPQWPEVAAAFEAQIVFSPVAVEGDWVRLDGSRITNDNGKLG